MNRHYDISGFDDENLLKTLCNGTTTYHKKLRILWRNSRYVLVRHPGEMVGSSPLAQWVPSWVELYDTIEPKVLLGVFCGDEVWNTQDNGRIGSKRLRGLVAHLTVNGKVNADEDQGKYYI